MARTSKTKIGSSGESNDRMMRASATGAEAVAQAHSQLLAQGRAGAEQTMQTAKFASDSVQQHEDRQTQKQQFESKMAQDSAQFSEKMAQDESQFSRGLAQRESETELDAAKAGYEKGGEEGEQGQGNERQAKLDAEMQKGQGQPKLGPLDPESQQRLGDATQQKLEMDGQGRWRPTQERKDNQARAQRREDFQADTERIRAIAYRDQVGVSAQKAYASGDMELYEEKAQEAASYANASQKLYDRVKKGEIRDEDWAAIAKEAKGSEDVDPSLMDAIGRKDASERVLSHLRARIQFDAMSSIVRTGAAENVLKIDWTMPKMREFIQTRDAINDFNRANPALSQTAMISSTQDKMRFINQTAALQVLMQMGSAQDPSGGQVPATDPAQQGGAAGPRQPMVPPGGTQVPGREQGASAVRGARAGGASPQQALQAGQQAHPTNEDEIDRERMRQRHLSSQVQGMR